MKQQTTENKDDEGADKDDEDSDECGELDEDAENAMALAEMQEEAAKESADKAKRDCHVTPERTATTNSNKNANS